MDKNTYKVIGICGSLRKDSYNNCVLEYMVENTPESLDIENISIKDFPLFNEDVEAQGFPIPVKEVRKKIREADGIIFLCPEYNSSISGVLKNAIDWISRKDDQGYPFSKKPIMIAGATTGLIGTARAQKELRGVLNNLNTFPMNKPEFFITEAEKKIFNQKLVDERAKEIADKMLKSFIKWIELIKQY